MDQATLDALKANYKAPAHLAGIAEPKKKRGGVLGFAEDTAKAVAHPFGYLLDSAIGNPTRELAAQFTGNKEAYKNASQRTNKTLGLGKNGTDIGNAFKTWGGNSAQALLTVAAPEVKSIKQGAAIGAGFGGTSALAQQGSTAEDIAKQSLIGAALGGGTKAIGSLFSKTGDKLGAGGAEMEGRAAGIGTGEKVAGSPMKVSRQEELLKWGQDNGMPVGKARNMAKWTEAKTNEITQKLDSAIKAADKPLEPTKAVSLSQKFRDAINSDITLRNNPQAQELADQLGTGISEIDTLGKQIAERRNLQNGINFNRGSASPDPLKERIFDAARRVLNEDINTISPEIKAINMDYNKISDIEQGVLGAAGRLTRASEAGSGGNSAIGMLLKGDTAQEVKSMMGRFGRNTGEKISGVASDGIPSAVGGGPKGILSSITGAARNTGLGANPEMALALKRDNTEIPAPTPLQDTTDTSLNTDVADTTDTTTPTTPFTSENIQKAILADVAANGGKNTASLISLYKTFGQTGQLSADEKKSKAKISGALTNLSVLEGLYKKAGGGQQRGPGFISNLLGRAGIGNTSAVQSYNKVRDGLVAPIARAMGETGVLTDEDRRVYAQMLPSITDRPEEVKLKLDAIREALNSVSTNNPSSTQDLLSQLQGIQ